MHQGHSAKPTAIAGVTPNVRCIRTKLYQAKCGATAACRFSTFLLNVFVRRVNLRIDILIVEFCLSTSDVESLCILGLPTMRCLVTDTTTPLR